MKEDVNHFDSILPSLVMERDLSYTELNEKCSGSRYQSLKDYLDTQYEVVVARLQKEKSKKLKQLTSTQCEQTTDWWIKELNLTETSKNFIVNNQQICD